MERNSIALYTGWGPYETQNPGDTVCQLAAHLLLEESQRLPIFDARTSKAPISVPWNGPVIIGGGTTLPKVFRHNGRGLKYGEPKIVYGSGVLSPSEIEAKAAKYTRKDPPISKDESGFENTQVVGVRGPLSCEHYKGYFNQTVEYVGDLGFAFARKEPVKNPHGDSLFFMIENEDAVRTESNADQIRTLYSELSIHLNQEQNVLCWTDDRQCFDDIRCNFDRTEKLPNGIELINRIKQAKFIVTERLHPAILAADYGIPFLYLQTTSKSRDLQRLLADGPSILNRLFIDMKQSPGSLAEAYNAIKSDGAIPYRLVESANSVKSRLENGAEKIGRIMRVYYAGVSIGEHEHMVYDSQQLSLAA